MAALQLPRLLGCNVYVSEGRNLQLVRQLEELVRRRRPAVGLANTFVDQPYNRTGLTLVASCPAELSAAVAGVAAAALAAVDLRAHAADHPRLGVVDHVSLHPLGPRASLSLAAEAAAAVGGALSRAPLGLPVYYYGEAHPAGRQLAEIRRRLGYFRSSAKPGAGGECGDGGGGGGGWTGALAADALAAFPPDAGPPAAPPAAGVVTVGAVPWVVNFNVPLHTGDVAAARRVARAVSARGGGLPGVEAMALQHGPGVVEVATNLTCVDWRQLRGDGVAAAAQPMGQPTGHRPPVPGQQQQQQQQQPLQGAGPDAVMEAIAAAARREGLPPPGQGYVTNRLPHELLALAAQELAAGGGASSS